jgi:hypothetical protein
MLLLGDDDAGTMVHRVPRRQHGSGLVDEEGRTVEQAPDNGRQRLRGIHLTARRVLQWRL